MEGILKFFLNAFKAIIFSPFYIIYFVFAFLVGLINYLWGEIRVVFSGFRYGSKNENKYTIALRKISNEQGGDKV